MVFPDHVSDEQSSSEEHSQNIDAIAKFIAALSRLTDTLPAGALPDRGSRSMEFFAQSKDYYRYPELVKDWLLSRNPSDIRVTTTFEHGTLASTTIEIANDQDSGLFYISREILDNDPSEPDCIIDPTKPSEEQIIAVPRIPDSQLSAFLLSICRENVASELAEVTGDNSGLNEDMADKLAKNAFLVESDTSYELPSGRTVQVRTESLAGQSRLTSFTIYYETGSSRRLRASIDTSTGVVVEFQTIDTGASSFGDNITDVPYVNILHPDEGDYVRLTEILTEETENLSSDFGQSMSVAPDDMLEVFDTADNTGTQITD